MADYLSKLGDLPDNKQEGFVLPGALTSFAENIPGLLKQDVLDSMLYAQLRADMKHNSKRETVDWYLTYMHFLSKVGFKIEDVAFKEYKTSEEKLTLGKVVINNLAEVADPKQLAALTSTLDTLRSTSQTDKRLKLFYSKNSNVTSGGNFQVQHCELTPDGNVSIIFGIFLFESSKILEHGLDFSVDKDSTKIYKRVQKATLDSNVYEDVRSTIRSFITRELGDAAIKAVLSLEL